jgi:hypothetical protein
MGKMNRDGASGARAGAMATPMLNVFVKKLMYTLCIGPQIC